MFGGKFSTFLPAVGLYAAAYAALAAAALAIKLMDDVVDAPRDRVQGNPNWTRFLGRSATPYALLSLTVAVALNKTVAVAVFLAAYAWGMADGLRAVMPSGLAGWHESLLAVAVSWLAAGWSMTGFALALVGAVHLADDWLDGHWPAQKGSGGFGPAAPGLLPVAVALLAAVGLLLQPELFIGGAAIGGVLTWITRRSPGPGGVTP